MTGPSSAPRGERAGTPTSADVCSNTELRRIETVVTDDQPEPRPNRATRRALARKARR